MIGGATRRRIRIVLSPIVVNCAGAVGGTTWRLPQEVDLPVQPVMRTVYVVSGTVASNGLPSVFLPSGIYAIPEHGTDLAHGMVAPGRSGGLRVRAVAPESVHRHDLAGVGRTSPGVRCPPRRTTPGRVSTQSTRSTATPSSANGPSFQGSSWPTGIQDTGSSTGTGRRPLPRRTHPRSPAIARPRAPRPPARPRRPASPRARRPHHLIRRLVVRLPVKLAAGTSAVSPATSRPISARPLSRAEAVASTWRP